MILQKFKNWLAINVNSKRTVESYCYEIERFFKAIEGENNLNQDTLNQYLKQCKEKYSSNQYNVILFAIKKLTIFLKKDLEFPKPEKINLESPDFITREYFEKEIIPVVECIFENPLKIKAILYFMFFTGVRKHEVAILKREHINLKTRRAKIFGKRKKPREVIFNKITTDILERYFSLEHETINAFNMEYSSIGWIFKKINPYLREVNFRPLLMRHSWATYYLKKGLDISEISKILGHSQIQTTMRYANANIDNIQEKIDKIK